MTFYFGPKNAAVERRFAALEEKKQDSFLWVDFHAEFSRETWNEIQGRLPKFPVLACVVPARVTALLYERLSRLVDLTRGKKLVCLFCSGKESVDSRLRELFSAYLTGRGIPDDLKTRVHHFSAEEVLWSPEAIRQRFHIKLAWKVLATAQQDENEHFRACTTDDIRPWRQDMRAALAEEVGKCEQRLGAALSRADFSIDHTEVTTRLGHGRPPLRRRANPEPLLSSLDPKQNITWHPGRELPRTANDLSLFRRLFLRFRNIWICPEPSIPFPFFVATERPFENLPEEIKKIDEVMPLFYDFPETTSGNIRPHYILEHLAEHSGTGQASVLSSHDLREYWRDHAFWREGEGLEHLLRDWLPPLQGLIEQFSRARGNNRRQLRNDLVNDENGRLTLIIRFLRQNVDAEIERIRAGGIIRSADRNAGQNEPTICDPAQYHAAYLMIHEVLLVPVANLRLTSWMGRRLLWLIPLQRFPWLPGLFHPRTVIMRRLNELLGEIIRLLNLYQYAFTLLSSLRHDFQQSMLCANRLNDRINRLRKHRENIFLELEAAAEAAGEVHPGSGGAEIPVKFAEELPDTEALLTEKIGQAIPAVTNLVTVSISSMAPASRPPVEQTPVGDLAAFVPKHYQFTEAWRAAREMLGIAAHEAFAGIKGSLPEGQSEYLVRCQLSEIPDLAEDGEWRSVKRKALLSTSEPFEFDAVVRQVPEGWASSSFANWIIENGLRRGIFMHPPPETEMEEEANGVASIPAEPHPASIGLAPDQDGPWLSTKEKEYRHLFYQCSPGLTRGEFIARSDQYILASLKSWLCHASAAELAKPGIESGIPIWQKILATRDEEQIWDILSSLKIDEEVDQGHDFIHPFLGRPKKVSAHFMLLNTLDPCLMRFFRPGKTPGDISTRFFPENYLRSLFSEDEMLRALFFSRIFDHCIRQGEVPPYPFHDEDQGPTSRSDT